MLSLFLCLSIAADASPINKHKKKFVEDTMTVAAIRPSNGGEAFTKVTFIQSQRFYKLAKDADASYMRLLEESKKSGTPIVVRRPNIQSDIIISVRKR